MRGREGLLDIVGAGVVGRFGDGFVRSTPSHS